MDNELYLGINICHDTSAALFKGSRFVGAVEQERFDGIRNSCNFPIAAINFLLNKVQTDLNTVKHIATSFDFNEFVDSDNFFEEHIIHSWFGDVNYKRRQRDNNLFFLDCQKKLDEAKLLSKVEPIKHHYCHALSAFHFSKFKEAAVLVIDGRGECESTSIWYANQEEGLTKIKSFPISQSIGHVYTGTTAGVGLYSSRGKEGKTMGLASYGESNPDFKSVMAISNDGYQVDHNILKKILSNPYRNNPFHAKNFEIAASTQASLEEVLLHLVNLALKYTKSNNLVLSGGVALNSDANGNLIKKMKGNNLFIYPACHDAGTAVGAALALMPLKLRNHFSEKLGNSWIYSGPSTDCKEIKRKLNMSDIGYFYLYKDDLVDTVSELLVKKKIGGWFQGCQEFGPRALGNRSILCHPGYTELRDKINMEIKVREFWRPFAPSILEENIDDFFESYGTSPYMNINYKVKIEAIEKIPAVVHINNTSRIQTVSKNENPLYYALISKFYSKTGLPLLLNTSLNMKGRPIATTIDDALNILYTTSLDFLAIENFLILKDIELINDLKRSLTTSERIDSVLQNGS